MQDIRWRQRFEHFEKAFLLLQTAIHIPHLSVVERAGLIQFFEMSFELAWKLLKDYETEQGLVVKTPRDAIKQAFQANLIRDGHAWIDALQDRNLTAHTYNEQTAFEVEQRIKNTYFRLLYDLYHDFKSRLLQCPMD